jgi:hypothetical protein
MESSTDDLAPRGVQSAFDMYSSTYETSPLRIPRFARPTVSNLIRTGVSATEALLKPDELHLKHRAQNIADWCHYIQHDMNTIS